MFRGSRPRRTQDADAVRFVHVDASAEGLGPIDQTAQLRNVALHAEDAFGDNQNPLRRGAVFEAAVEVIEIVVPETDHARGRPQRALHQAGVEVVIADHGVALFGQRRKRRVVGLKPGAEDDGRFFVHEGGQLRFELHVQIQRAIQQAGAAASAAIFLDGVARRLLSLPGG